MRLLYKILSVTILFSLVALIIDTSTSTHQNRRLSVQDSDTPYNGSLRVGIVLNDYTYINQGHTVGYHYELMNRFAHENGHIVDISLIRQRDTLRQDIFDNDFDVIILNRASDEVPLSIISRTLQGIELNDNQDIFIVRNGEYDLLMDINRWVGYFKFSEDYKNMISNYYKRYKTGYLKTEVARLSPYDKLIKKYAAEIKWDWRLLASIVYQESQFSPVARSGKEAGGLMQIRPITADYLGVENIYDPEQNIKAGTAMLKRLEKMYHNSGIDSLNLLKFTLAAYNAGEGRIEDVRNYAAYRGVNSHDWDSVSVVIDGMRDMKRGDIVKLGPFRGTETINYVDEVISRYENYKQYIR